MTTAVPRWHEKHIAAQILEHLAEYFSYKPADENDALTRSYKALRLQLIKEMPKASEYELRGSQSGRLRYDRSLSYEAALRVARQWAAEGCHTKVYARSAEDPCSWVVLVAQPVRKKS